MLDVFTFSKATQAEKVYIKYYYYLKGNIKKKHSEFDFC